METLPVIHIEQSVKLPDNKQWTNRFEIKSETSDRIYVVSQNIKGRYWGCSCPGWKAYKKCKHLSALGLANYMRPQEIEVHHE